MSEIVTSLPDVMAEVSGEPVHEGGRLVCQVRCRIPVKLDASSSMLLPVVGRAKSEEGGVEIEYKAKDGEKIISGIASSTSVDWHGTEMSLQALRNMVAQFKRGVSQVPSHFDDEWDQMIGRTVDAEIEQREVVNPADEAAEIGDPQYVLRVYSVVYGDNEKGKLLLDRVDRGDTIGWSIGGWFTDMRVIYDEEGEQVERIIIEKVELDHLAVTRKPSNPDSWLEGVRIKALGAVAAYRAKSVDAVERDESIADEATPVRVRAEDADGGSPGPADEPGDGQDAPQDPQGGDEFPDEQQAKIRGEALGCGLFAHETDGGQFMPCASADAYQEALYAENAHPDGTSTLTGDDEQGGVELSVDSTEAEVEKIDECAELVETRGEESDIFEGVNVDSDNKQGSNTHPTGDSLMSNEIERTESASTQPEEAVVSVLNEKVDALTRTVEALVALQSRTEEPVAPETEAAQPEVVEPDTRLDAISRNIEALAGLMMKREEERAEVPAAKGEAVEEDAEKVELRARLSSMEGKIARMARKPTRRVSRFARDEIRQKDIHPDGMILEAVERHMGSSALVSVARDMEDVIYYDKRVHGREKLPDRGDLQDALRAVLMAASVDGLINNPDFS